MCGFCECQRQRSGLSDDVHMLTIMDLIDNVFKLQLPCLARDRGYVANYFPGGSQLKRKASVDGLYLCGLLHGCGFPHSIRELHWYEGKCFLL